MDLEVRYGRVRISASGYLILIFCSCSTPNYLSWKTDFKVIITMVKNFLSLIQNLLTCFITNTALRSYFFMNRLTFYNRK